ncbi:hypothetical protein M513_08316 [Trichuris suis]|uniref:Uncharacterized protein n=1 Tax=Trichuris suis TaxID=68888 RepID=A0A085M0M9_9BILA|nr:hypothetical protein M513_08316 [Trichuris suis]
MHVPANPCFSHNSLGDTARRKSAVRFKPGELTHSDRELDNGEDFDDLLLPDMKDCGEYFA